MANRRFFCTFAALSHQNDVQMNRIFLLVAVAFTLFSAVLTSCSSTDSYAAQKEREQNDINAFIASGVSVVDPLMKDTLLYVPPIKVISEAEFAKKDSVTDVAKNEYVLLSGSGIYMQIISKGQGETLKSGETSTILGRYVEYNLSGDSIQSTNINNSYETTPEVYTCTNTSGTYTATFLSGLMYSKYSSTSVPSGWLAVMPYIKLGRQAASDSSVAKVRIIVPSTAGQSDALSNTYACFYELTLMKSR